jgi:hypothetical protein
MVAAGYVDHDYDDNRDGPSQGNTYYGNARNFFGSAKRSRRRCKQNSPLQAITTTKPTAKHSTTRPSSSHDPTPHQTSTIGYQ